MIIDKEGFFHLTHCSNIYAGESWPEVLSNLKKYVPVLKKHLAPNIPFGIGLRLSNLAADQLLQAGELENFKNWLSEKQLYIVTINGFPYGGFHNQRVKEQVYAPDWSTPERRDYSLKLVRILAELTPAGSETGFSTSPLSYKPWCDIQSAENIKRIASISISNIVVAMATIERIQGKYIHIDIEPEPDCLIETVEEFIDFFNNWLLPIGIPYLVTMMKISAAQATAYLYRHVRICYDICHSSVEYENPAIVFKQLADANIGIGKIQISAALKGKCEHERVSKKILAEHLSSFADEVYLHQVIERYPDNTLRHYSDLSEALTQFKTSQSEELRTHFHVPVFLDRYQDLHSTQDDIITTLKLAQKNQLTRHLEIETYTWDVLPTDMKLDLVSSLKREYEWVLSNFS